MRDIKFRAIITGTNNFIFGLPNAVYLNNKIDSIQCLETKKVEYINTDTLGQYIGIKDKNGVDIYEGDIITFDGITSYGAAIIARVIYSEERLRYEYTQYDGISNQFRLLSMTPPRVIGNIHAVLSNNY